MGCGANLSIRVLYNNVKKLTFITRVDVEVVLHNTWRQQNLRVDLNACIPPSCLGA